MAWIEGRTLAQVLAERSREDAGSEARAFQPSTADGRHRLLILLEGIARALHVAHEAGIIHRDVKPANVMVTPLGTPVLLDFGLARIVDGEASLTRTGALLGTPAYLAPEQIRDATRVDRRCDIHALGVTAFECLTGVRPFEAPTREGLIDAILRKNPPHARQLNPTLSRDAAAVLETALEKDPDRRYATAAALAADLAALRAGTGVSVKPPSLLRRGRRWAESHRAAAALIASLAVLIPLVAAFAGYFVATWPDRERGRQTALREAKDDATAHAFLALLGEGGEARDAKGQFESILETHGPEPRTLAGYALACAFLADWEPARHLFDRHGALVESSGALRLMHRVITTTAVPAHPGRGGVALVTALDYFVAAYLQTLFMDKSMEGDWGEVLDLIDRAIDRSGSSDPIQHIVRLSALVVEGDPERVRDAVDIVTRKWPDNAHGWHAAGLALRRIGDLPASRAAQERACAMAPDAAGFPGELGVVMIQEGDIQGALAYLERHPPERFAASWAQMGIGLLEIGRTEEALAILERARGHDRNGILHRHLGDAYRKSGRIEEAVEAYTAARKLRPIDRRNLNNLALTLVMLGRLDEAESAARVAVQAYPDVGKSWYTLGIIQRKQARFGESLRSFETARRHTTDDPGLTAILDAQDAVARRDAKTEEAFLAWKAEGESALGDRSLDDLLAMADWKGDFAAAADLWALVFARDPAREGDLARGDRLDAARAAARAGATDRALAWMTAECAAWQEAARTNPRMRRRFPDSLAAWRADPAFEAYDDAPAWQALWASADDL
jgi:serine/threonine-protein kinase